MVVPAVCVYMSLLSGSVPIASVDMGRLSISVPIARAMISVEIELMRA